jgi:hypothetical protein
MFLRNIAWLTAGYAAVYPIRYLEMWGFHGIEDSCCCYLGYEIVLSGIFLPRRWKQYNSPKRVYIPTTLDGAATQKTAM